MIRIIEDYFYKIGLKMFTSPNDPKSQGWEGTQVKFRWEGVKWEGFDERESDLNSYVYVFAKG